MTRRFRLASLGCRAFAGALALVPLATHAQASPHYRIAHELPLPGDEGWDYLAFEAGGHRPFENERSEEDTSEPPSQSKIVCPPLLEKKKKPMLTCSCNRLNRTTRPATHAEQYT